MVTKFSTTGTRVRGLTSIEGEPNHGGMGPSVLGSRVKIMVGRDLNGQGASFSYSLARITWSLRLLKHPDRARKLLPRPVVSSDLVPADSSIVFTTKWKFIASILNPAGG